MIANLRSRLAKAAMNRRVKVYGLAAEAALQITAAHAANGQEMYLESFDGQRYSIKPDGTWISHNAPGY